jgi:hypothetical protein
MKVQAGILSLTAILILLPSPDVAKSPGDSAAFAKGQLWLSPVSVGDCVAPRISAKRTRFVDELDEKYCTENNPDEAKAKVCIENSKLNREIYFFTDRCSEGEYFIGINGKEFKLKRISRRPGEPTNFIGYFAGEGVSVEISHPRLIKKTYDPDEPRSAKIVLDAEYRVLVTVEKGNRKKTFRGILWYGR